MSERVVVIGSGPPGAVACSALCEAGIDTLLLEAGLERRALGLVARVRGVTVAKARRALAHRPGVTMKGDPSSQLFEDLSPGGLSNHWSCAVPRFDPEDFLDAERAGEEQKWPLGYEELSPWYDRVEPLLRISGQRTSSPHLPAGRVHRAIELASSWKEVERRAPDVGRSLTPMPYAYGASNTVRLSGNAFNAFDRLVKPARRSGHLSIAFGARVVRLEWSPKTRRVERVVIRNAQNGVEDTIPCRAVILAAGAVTSAQILLESRSADFPDGIANTHGVLGRYLHDHPLGKLVLDLGVPIGVYPPVYLTRNTLDRSEPLYAAACMQWSGGVPLARSVLQGHPARLTEIGFSVFGTMVPTRDDWVALDPERPRVGGTSALALRVQHPPQARVALEQARDDLVEVLKLAGFDPRVRVWRVEAAGNANHYGGTCRMHASPRFGMVDERCRIHSVANAVVAGSAVFTTGPEKNPVLTAMALAARATASLVDDLKQGDL